MVKLSNDRNGFVTSASGKAKKNSNRIIALYFLHQLYTPMTTIAKYDTNNNSNPPLPSPRRPSFPRRLELEQFATSRVERAEAREKEKKLQKLQQLQQQQQNDDDGCSQGSQCSQHQPTSRDNRLPARGETPLLMLDRWRKLHDELYDSVTGFDITKVQRDSLF